MTAAHPADLRDRLAALSIAPPRDGRDDADLHGRRPELVVAPASTDEAAAVLRVAAETGAAVIPVGGGTAQRVGAPPLAATLAVSTTAMSGLVEWEPADLTASVEAGITLAALQQTLATRGQQVPLDAPVPDRATVGGLVATATAGPRRWRHGGWRDLIIGMTMALTDGSVINSGGRVVKNVQGYDLAKLFTGSLGTLGLICRVNLKLVPLPDVRRLLVARGGAAAVCAFLEAVAASTVQAATLDLLDEAAARAAGLEGRGYAGLVLLEGSHVPVSAQTDAAARLGREAGVSLSLTGGPGLAQRLQAWIDLDRVDDLTPDEARLTVATRPNRVGDALGLIEATAARHGCRARIWARAGNGIVSARLGHERAVEAIPAVQAELLTRFPATTLAAGDPAVAAAARPWGAEPAGVAIMRSLKQRFDPTGVLQAGRYVGGI